ncbi:MAG: peptidyl-prolyl cis-trans isomerase [Burkholderiales bacterium]|nr:peptidyl-prolyl cis-trans isomerase [Burkholderiales bacterium]
MAARVNGVPIQRLSLDVLARMAQMEDPKISRTVVLESIIANRLLAKAGEAQIQEFDLRAQGKRVAFAREVQLDDQVSGHLRTVFRDEIEAEIKKLPGANLDSVVLEQAKIDSAQLDQVFGPRSRILLDYNLNAEQLERAKQVLVLRSSLKQGASVTLYDVYRRQNVQGRLEFFNRNLDFIRQQAMLYIANLYVQDWATKRFGAAAVQDLRQTLADQVDVRSLMALHGIGADIDAESQLVNQLAKRITPEEVQAYYAAHKEEFKRIEWVKARHIRLADEAKANEVVALAAKGGEFAKLAQQYSIARDAKQGGDLGIIKHQGKLSWLAELAFMQEEGKVSPPFRAAVGPKEEAYWEVVLVEKKQEGFQDVNSESVRYLAGRAIAQEKAAKQITSLREQLLKSAKVEVNRSALELPPAAHRTSGKAR